ncbi:MAG: hypothetical protein LBS50_08390 [Prevotellaceae bacterium]|nr:hypothetical protein [Prevotellaceae bacterium]
MKLFQKILFQVFTSLLLLTAAVCVVCNLIWKNFGIPLMFWIVPAFFMLNGIMLALFAKRYEKKQPPAQMILLVKMPKLFLALFIIAVAFFFENETKTPTMPFCTFFLLTYILYDIYESQILLKLNKNK